MQQIIFNCQTITPMFLAGADGTTPELRPPSIKGALRFWWRAMNGHLKLEDLREQEAAIFGDTTRRSKVVVRTVFDRNDLERRRNINQKGFVDSTTHPLNYLSYGTWHKTKEESRGYIEDGFQFDLELHLHPSLDKNQRKEVITAFKTFVAFGNLGMKMRNGFGSFQVLNEQIDAKKLFDEIMIDTKEDTPTFHAFSKKASLSKTQKNNYVSWQEALKGIGEFYKEENKIKWDEDKGEDDARHAKSYFLKINKMNSGYEGQILILPCTSSINGYDKKIKNFESALSKGNLFI